MNLQSYLELKVNNFEDELFQFQIKGSNNYFSGTTIFYEDVELLKHLSSRLIDFPKHEKFIFFELGDKDSGFSIRFYPADSLSHIGVKITIAAEMLIRAESQCRVEFEIMVEPNAIDDFRKAINQIILKRSGIAILYGNDNRLS
ncbi:hypothetical protein C1637_19555 [Chryseobacterium lactis]|uniref:Uncharacterized protein n=1 Tax=Chryseobacterium lactis TaxID=1241981 RepID=A0A3G6RKQ6_CHRLC|nr:hypothetical protein [Chryseobacterium lactis]AZA83153.1 hypothetical protein EG342_15270 [Chryseobacterium lactis]AZB03537.1 hypothetical protein EG341_06140 [Chryseobacterium lactis]PNW11957.1 hypothetical protein C1637_19555 [Chryseobacterium lactis]